MHGGGELWVARCLREIRRVGPVRSVLVLREGMGLCGLGFFGLGAVFVAQSGTQLPMHSAASEVTMQYTSSFRTPLP